MGLIDRWAALDALDRLEYTPGEWATNGLTMCKDAIKALPSAQPTDAEIQRMQDMMQDIEQAMLGKAYECGKQDAQRWIPCEECDKRCKQWENSKI